MIIPDLGKGVMQQTTLLRFQILAFQTDLKNRNERIGRVEFPNIRNTDEAMHIVRVQRSGLLVFPLRLVEISHFGVDARKAEQSADMVWRKGLGLPVTFDRILQTAEFPQDGATADVGLGIIWPQADSQVIGSQCFLEL